jgi:hypothetical protein
MISHQVVIPFTQRLPAWQIVGASLPVGLVAAIVVIVTTRWLHQPDKETHRAS